MNKAKLKKAQQQFFKDFPGGFAHPEMIKIGKKHKMDKMVEFAQEAFNQKACENIESTCDNMVTIINRSSMVSMFEKPKFRDFIYGLNENDQSFLVGALTNLLHGKQSMGFEAMVDLLKTAKLAKWSLISIIPAYFRPQEEVFVKPTTAKNVLRYFEIESLVYRPTPTWGFYRAYRELLNQMKDLCDESLSPSNAAFSGFLMMSMPQD